MRALYSCSDISVIVLLLFSVIGCKGSRQYFFDDCTKVNSFPIEYNLPDSGEVLGINGIGVLGIRAFDSNILLSCSKPEGCVELYDTCGHYIGSTAKVGRGPGELLQSPYMSWLDVYSENGDIVADTFDQKGNYVRFDIIRSIEQQSVSYNVLWDSLSVEPATRYFLLDECLLHCRKCSPDDRGFKRYVMEKSGKKHIPVTMEILNSFKSDECNLLAAMTLVNKRKQLIAELGSRMSVVNIYSVSEDETMKSLLLKNESLSRCESLPEEKMPKAYYDAKGYESFFVGLYLGTTIEALDDGKFPPPQLHFFSWEGEPLARINLPLRTLFFDIDLASGALYTVDFSLESIARYSLSSILRDINNLSNKNL